ncbi:disulfide bond formation protein B [Acetobacter sp.]|uniref:disulfide bond formation protein B n=1 Tax=Acetobacter sp. TaxID=440 RepID=UPI0039E803BE
MMSRRRIFSRQTPVTVRLPSLLLIVSGAIALAFAWWLENGRGLVPCALCLWERWPWRILIAIGLVGMMVPRRWARSVSWCGVPPLLAAIVLSVIHAGVEWGFWASPLPECAAPRLKGQTIAERLASMPLQPGKPCDQPSYLFDWLPVSLTELGGLAALLVLIGFVMLLRGVGDRI